MSKEITVQIKVADANKFAIELVEKEFNVKYLQD